MSYLNQIILGTATTGVVAIKNGRNFIGIELSEEYCEIARRRVVEASRQQKLF